MAVLLRFLHSPSLTHNFPTEQQQLTRTPLSNLSTYNYKHNLSHSVSIKTKRRLSNSNFVLRFSSSTTQEQAQAPSSSSSPNVSTETQVLEPETEEFSRDRLIAQNVPWSCTAEDVRTLFEKHGTVLDVEVFILFFSFFNLFWAILFCGFCFLLVFLIWVCGFFFFFFFWVWRLSSLCITRSKTEVWPLSQWVRLRRPSRLSIISTRM